MKEDKFNKIIRDRLYDHQMPVPDDIWDKLEAELQVTPHTKVPLFKRYSSIAAIAASLILIGSLSLYIVNQMAHTGQAVATSDHSIKSPVTTPVEKITDKLSENKELHSTDMQVSPTPELTAATLSIKKKIQPTYTKPDVIQPDIKSAEVQLKEDYTSPEQKDQTQTVSDEEKAAKTRAFLQDGQNARSDAYQTTTVKHHEKSNDNVQLAVNFGNSGFANSLQKQPYATLRTKIDKNMVQFAQDMHPHSMGSRTNVKHHAPLSFGIMISKELPLNFAIESGIRYTYMNSELKNPEETRKESQQLHYLGVPLSIKYSFWKWRNFNAYAKAGGAIDFNIAGTWKELYNYQADFGTG
ncbi:MAG: outer membrane beta-barrel protein, partial [Bacteroidales bacterium]